MLQQPSFAKQVNLGVVGLFGLGLPAVDAPLAFAGNCGGHCQVMKTFLILKPLPQIAAALNGRGIATARRGKWEAATVENALKQVTAQRASVNADTFGHGGGTLGGNATRRAVLLRLLDDNHL